MQLKSFGIIYMQPIYIQIKANSKQYYANLVFWRINCKLWFKLLTNTKLLQGKILKPKFKICCRKHMLPNVSLLKPKRLYISSSISSYNFFLTKAKLKNFVAFGVQRQIVEKIIVHLLPFRSLNLVHKCKRYGFWQLSISLPQNQILPISFWTYLQAMQTR